MNGRIILIILVAVLFFMSCNSTPPPFSIEKPEGFAIAEVGDGELYSAVSPEGILFDIKTAENYPVKDIDFWGNALRNQFIDNGYQLYKEEEISIENGSKGIYFEWLAPFASSTYIYLTFITVEGDNIIIAEAAGEVKLFADYREALIESIKTISINSEK